MLAVLLTILKVIGIILLSILGLILLILLLLLFVPLRYKAEAYKYEAVDVRVHATWLLHLVHVMLSYDGTEVVKKLKILGIPFKIGEDDQGDGDSGEKSEDVTEADAGTEADAEEQTEDRSEAKAEGITETETKSEAEADEEAEADSETESEAETETEPAKDSGQEHKEEPAAEGTSEAGTEAKTEAEPEEKPETTTGSSEDNEADDASAGEAKDSPKKSRVEEKLSGIYNKYKHYRDTISDPHFKNGLKYAWSKLVAMLRHILPKKLKLKVHYGFEDPSTTGLITAGIGMFYGGLKDSVTAIPDFENEVLEGSAVMAGRVRLGTLLFYALQVLLKKDCRFVYKTIKAEGENKNG